MTGDPHVPRRDWLQQARIEISSNAIIFHDETFVKMATVEDILNRLSEERQRCYRAHLDAEARPQKQKQPVVGCWYYQRTDGDKSVIPYDARENINLPQGHHFQKGDA